MRLNKHIPKCILKKIIKEKTINKTKTVVDDTKRFSIAERFINNADSANNNDLLRFKVVQFSFTW